MPHAIISTFTSPTDHPMSVRLQDRVVDCVAALLVGVGILLFAVGRQALGAIANGTYRAPKGELWVTVADLHTSQTRWGTWLVCAGVVVALASATRHLIHRRATTR